MVSREPEDSIHNSDAENSSPSSTPDMTQLVLDPSESTEWQRTIRKVIKSVVAIHMAFPFDFDMEECCTSEATGFVVDAERGIIMTNRHVIGSGPFIGYAVFDNHEECDVWPIYRDPVHDFGFLRFDPTKIKYLQLTSLPLHPELAKIGTEIRVVGNDAGEKLSILSGYISRIDRNAPCFGQETYNDFNTEYIQASSNATGGSSGSPVVDIGGKVLGLQSSGRFFASTNYFVPLYRPARALRLIQKSQPISRGTIQTKWLKQTFDHCRRLGVSNETELAMRKAFPATIGMLLADTVLPEGPCDGLIKVSDCLVSINDTLINSFIQVDEILDASVGQDLTIVVDRAGKQITVKVTVGDLHAITPRRFVDINGTAFQDVGYQIAMGFSRPVKGVYVSSSETVAPGAGGRILLELDGKPTPNLDAFLEVVKALPNDLQYAAKVVWPSLNCLASSTTFTLYNLWESRIKLYTLNESSGISVWDIEQFPEIPPPKPVKKLTVSYPPASHPNSAFNKLFPNIVHVNMFPQRGCINASEPRIFSVGLGNCISSASRDAFVLDPVQGIILAPLVIEEFVQVVVQFANSVDVPGKIIFRHPTMLFSIISYDPSHVDAPIEPLRFSDVPLKVGEEVFVLGSSNGQLVVREEKVSSINFTGPGQGSEGVCFPPNHTIGTALMVNSDGLVRGFGLNYPIDVTNMMDTLNSVKDDTLDTLRFLPVLVKSIEVVWARKVGVPEGMNQFLSLFY